MKYSILINIFFIFSIQSTKSQDFRENLFEQIQQVLSSEFQDAVKEAEISADLGKPFEIEALRLRELIVAIEKQEESEVDLKLKDKIIKRENKMFGNASKTYEIATSYYFESFYIKYNVYAKTLNPLAIKATGEKKKKLLGFKNTAAALYKKANFSIEKAKNTNDERMRYQYYCDFKKIGVDVLNIQAEAFRLAFDWPLDVTETNK